MNTLRVVVLTVAAAILVISAIDPACAQGASFGAPHPAGRGLAPIGLDGMDLRQAGGILPLAVSRPPRLIGVKACVGTHHVSRKLNALGHDARLVLQRTFFRVS